MVEVKATPGAKMIYLIKRRPGAAREELVANWFKNHMPAVMDSQVRAAEKGRPHATRYIATLFDADDAGDHLWDGMAVLWWDLVLPMPEEPHGTEPTDTFQQKAEPYVPWATTEFVVLDGELPIEANTLNEPFPATRTGFVKATCLVEASDGIDHAALFSHWLEVHAPRVKELMEQVGGLRYVVSQSVDPVREPYVGMAELYFPDRGSFDAFNVALSTEDSTAYHDDQGSRIDVTVLLSHVQMVGIPG